MKFTYLSAEDVQVPSGYMGEFLTCTAFGSPVPIISWSRNGYTLNSQIIYSTVQQKSVYVSSKLIIRDIGFQSSFAGLYSCIVQQAGNDEVIMTSSVSIHLQPGHNKTAPNTICSDKTHSSFQIRALSNINCLFIINRLRHAIKVILNVLRSVVISECQDCHVIGDEIAISAVTCSTKATKAFMIKGTISSSADDGTKLYCALSRWIQMRPLIHLAGWFFPIDATCNLNAPLDTECNFSGSELTPLTVILSDTVVASFCAVLLFIIMVLFAVFVFLSLKLNKDTKEAMRYISSQGYMYWL